MSHLERTCEDLDASVFSSDMLFDEGRFSMFKKYLERWNRAVADHIKEEMAEQPAQPAPVQNQL